jgi:hypothetical protein
MFDSLLLRKCEAEKRAYLRAGIIAASIFNANPFRGKDARPVDPLDFVPGGKPAEPRAQTAQEQARVLTEIFGCGPEWAQSRKLKIENRKSAKRR